MSFTGPSLFKKWIRISVCCWDLAWGVENKQGTLLLWVKPCTSDTYPGVVDETIRIKEQPGNENDLEPPTTIAGKTKTQLRPPDQVFVNVSGSPYKPKNVKDSNRWYWWFAIWTPCIRIEQNRKILLSILSNIRYLAWQALPLRGRDWNTETKSEELELQFSSTIGKAVTRHTSNQCRWWNIVFSFKAGEDVFELNNGRL